MKTIQIVEQQYPIEVRAEARRIADRTDARYEDLPRIEAAVAHRTWRQAIEPILAMRHKLYSQALIGNAIHIIDPNRGLVRTELEPLSPSAIEAIKMVDEMIAAEAKRYGIAPGGVRES